MKPHSVYWQTTVQGDTWSEIVAKANNHAKRFFEVSDIEQVPVGANWSYDVQPHTVYASPDGTTRYVYEADVTLRW